ncbi:MAG: hypothetical protein NTY09_04305 [bacterium]|nr:hypothetical protein [bacterium]
MNLPYDDTERKQCVAFVDQIFTDAAGTRATEILFRVEDNRVQSFFMIDGKFDRSLTIPIAYWDLIKHILQKDYFSTGQHQLPYQGNICVFDWTEDDAGTIRLPITWKAIPGRRTDRLEDIFRSFEDPSWDAVKSIFLSILNLALAQDFDELRMALDGQIVEITYLRGGKLMTSMTISSDSYDALTRLIGENYFAFGFMTREFRSKEYLIRLKEQDKETVTPRIQLEIEILN